MDLRKAFFKNMCELAEKDEKIILITGDLGFSFYEEFAQKFPKQFVNAGCIEQSMIGIASGMSKAGLKPYVYSGSIFLICRAYEQIRDDVCYNNLNVKLIGTGASGFLGFTHNWEGTENPESLLQNLPNLDVFFPEDEENLRESLINNKATFIKI